MTIFFNYNKKQVLQALRYHFISRKEIRVMIILVNVFALLTLLLYAFKVISPAPFLMISFLWLMLMLSFWFILPILVYRRAETFKHEFSVDFEEEEFVLKHQNGHRTWPWSALSNYIETPHFFHFYFDSRSFFLIPKSGFKDSDEIMAMRQLLREKVKKK